MFLTLARWFQEQDQASNPSELEGSASKIFELHPIQLARALEEAYFAKDDGLRGPFPSPALHLTSSTGSSPPDSTACSRTSRTTSIRSQTAPTSRLSGTISSTRT